MDNVGKSTPGSAQSVWIIDGDESKRTQMHDSLVGHGYAVHAFEDISSTLTSPPRDEPLIVIVAERLATEPLVELLDQLNRARAMTLTIVTSSSGSIESAVNAFRYGAQDYLPEPYSIFELDDVIRRALEKANKKEGIAA